MAKDKLLSSKSVTFVKAGGNKMVGKQSAGPVKAGHTMGQQGGGGKFAKAGGNKMAGKQSAKPSKSC
jgi:hypothetical protein